VFLSGLYYTSSAWQSLYALNDGKSLSPAAFVTVCSASPAAEACTPFGRSAEADFFASPVIPSAAFIPPIEPGPIQVDPGAAASASTAAGAAERKKLNEQYYCNNGKNGTQKREKPRRKEF
jgi:hypothetical protein